MLCTRTATKGRILLVCRNLHSAAENQITINGKTYQTDPAYTNVTPSIINLTDRFLHLKENHPVGILREMIENKLNAKRNSYQIYNQFKPVVSVYDNFDSLGFPEDHPGRSKSDTYYVNRRHLLRTHTSAHEMQCFKEIMNSSKSGFLISADVYRRDEIDRTHYPAFHQMEGARVWERSTKPNSEGQPAHITQLLKDIADVKAQLANEKIKITVQDDTSLEGNPKQDYMTDLEVDLCQQHLKRSVELVVAEVFNKKIESLCSTNNIDIPKGLKVRWVKAYFPWTAPSWEIEVWWQGDWLEICGCGLVQQQVLLNAGYKPDTTIGWAFGLGLDRIAMLLFEIPDIRLFWTKDKRFHSQFQKSKISTFKSYSKYPGTLRDVAFWIPENFNTETIHENDVMEIVRNVAGDLVENVKLIDRFKHPKTNKTSLCYRINYQSMDRNITNDEINNLQEQVRQQLADKFQVELR